MVEWSYEPQDGSSTKADVSAGRHDAAVTRTLREADDAAGRGDHAGALGWLALVEAIGDRLPPSYESKRQAWLAARRAGEESA